MTNPVGRPLKFKTPDELQSAIEAYFNGCHDAEGKQIRPYSITGLALALDTTRQTIQDYQQRDEFTDTIKRAKLRVENFYEERLTFANATGPIFALKNFDWKDTSESTVKGDAENPLFPKQELSDKELARRLGSLLSCAATNQDDNT